MIPASEELADARVTVLRQANGKAHRELARVRLVTLANADTIGLFHDGHRQAELGGDGALDCCNGGERASHVRYPSTRSRFTRSAVSIRR